MDPQMTCKIVEMSQYLNLKIYSSEIHVEIVYGRTEEEPLKMLYVQASPW